MDSDLVAALRTRGVEVTTALEAGLGERSDDEHLAFAADHGCVLYSFNVSDFYRLHTACLHAGREHAGMILAAQQRVSVGELLRRILRLRAAAAATSLRNRVKFLSTGDDSSPRKAELPGLERIATLQLLERGDRNQAARNCRSVVGLRQGHQPAGHQHRER